MIPEEVLGDVHLTQQEKTDLWPAMRPNRLPPGSPLGRLIGEFRRRRQDVITAELLDVVTGYEAVGRRPGREGA